MISNNNYTGVEFDSLIESKYSRAVSKVRHHNDGLQKVNDYRTLCDAVVRDSTK